MEQATIDANRAQQAALYGRPLGDIVRDLTASLHLSQGRVAEVLGMSAPMLSQLASGQRVKMGNPQAVSRLQALLELGTVAATLSAAQLEEQVAGIAASATTLATAALPPHDVVARLASLSGPEGLIAAAAAAEPHSRALAAALRTAAGHHG